jgi:asparagine synthase (glutamine-hydrolysing)
VTSSTAVRGADPELVRRALVEAESLPGTAGFAGALDGRLVRDVLGREQLYAERDDHTAWSHDPTALASPVPVPAGSVRGASGTEQVWTLPDPDPRSGREAVLLIREALEATLADASGDGAAAGEGLAVAFSGGVDSALLAATLDATRYVAGFPGSHDLDAARSAARLLDGELRVVELDHATLEGLIPTVVAATGRSNPMDIGIALPLVAVAERAAAEGFDRLALGQGADELFGGYDKVANAPGDPRVAAETVAGARREVVNGLPGQLPRDVLALRAAGVEPVTPLLHDRVVRAALTVDGDCLVRNGQRKWAFRLATRKWLPDPVAFRGKKAVQYGSEVARELDRLARRAGFKRRMDDHVGQYIESLVD